VSNTKCHPCLGPLTVDNSAKLASLSNRDPALVGLNRRRAVPEFSNGIHGQRVRARFSTGCRTLTFYLRCRNCIGMVIEHDAGCDAYDAEGIDLGTSCRAHSSERREP
jgi:hypothetical protein